MDNPISNFFKKYRKHHHEIDFDDRFEDMEVQKRYLASIKPKKPKKKRT